MPKIQYANLPRPLWEHLLQRVDERRISVADLMALQEWVKTGPTAPAGEWLRTRLFHMNETLRELRVEQHPDKKSIGCIERGVRFWGLGLRLPASLVLRPRPCRILKNGRLGFMSKPRRWR